MGQQYEGGKEVGFLGIEGMNTALLTRHITAPSTFVIILLISVLFFLAYEFGNLQHQINVLHKENAEQIKLEHRLKDQLKILKKDVKGVMHEEVELMHKESMLEAKETKLERKNGGDHGNHHEEF